MDLTRKQFLAASGATAGALWAGNAVGLAGTGGPEAAAAAEAGAQAGATPTQEQLARRLIQNSWYLPVEDLESDEMRISFMGTSFTARVGQAMNSVFIEVGTGQNFVFDWGPAPSPSTRPWAFPPRAWTMCSSRICTRTT